MSDVRTRIQHEALQACSQYQRCGLAISMGVGKTLIGLRDMERVKMYSAPNPRFLVVAPSTVCKSWAAEAQKFGMGYLLNHITFCTYSSLIKHNPYDYVGLYLDEVHLLQPVHETFLRGYMGRILGLTGSPPHESSVIKFNLLQMYTPFVYTYMTDEAIEDGVLNDYRIFVHPVDLGKQKDVLVSFKHSKKQWYTSEVEHYKYYDDLIRDPKKQLQAKDNRIRRMKAMMTFPSKERYTKALLKRLHPNKTIVFANTKEQADRLCPHTYYSGNKQAEKNLELFKKGDIRQLGSINQLSVGVNIPGLTHGIILHAFGNEFKAPQKIGRFLRLPVDQIGQAHILMHRNTKDEDWVEKALSSFDPQKITYLKNPLF